MSNLQTFSLLHEKVNEINKSDPGEAIGVSFMKLALSVILKLNADEIEDSITDGPDDGEIDAVYIDDKTIHIFTFKYTDNFNQTKKNYPGTELDQFTNTLNLIISGELKKGLRNEAVWEKYEEIQTISLKGRLNFKIYIVSNKLPPVKNERNKIESALESFQITDKPYYLDQAGLVSKILENKLVKINGQITFIDRQHFEKSNGNIKTLIGAISAMDLIKLIENPDSPKQINENVFNENVRVYKPKHRVNIDIIDSAKSDTNYQFFYLNNGITILCSEDDYSPNRKSPVVNLKNLQIINGGQTSHSLFEVYKQDESKIETIEILIRVCVVKKDDPISEKISETSNSQIPIGSRDLRSNDVIQRRLEEEFFTLGYYYERKPNLYLGKSTTKVLNNELLGQIYMAYHLDMPSEAKNNKVRVFADLYDKIFNEEEITAAELLRLYNMYLPLLAIKKEIQSKKRKRKRINEKEAFLSRATFHILTAMKYLFQKQTNKINKAKIPQSEKETRISKLYTQGTSAIMKKAITEIGKIVEKEIKSRGSVYTHDKLFKETQTNILIIDHFT